MRKKFPCTYILVESTKIKLIDILPKTVHEFHQINRNKIPFGVKKPFKDTFYINISLEGKSSRKAHFQAPQSNK